MLRVPSKPSPQTQKGGVQQEYRWYACSPIGAVDTTTLTGKCEPGHGSGPTGGQCAFQRCSRSRCHTRSANTRMVHGRGYLSSCQRLNAVVDCAHRERNGRLHARPNNPREDGEWIYDALCELHQTWPRRRDDYGMTCVYGSTISFWMFLGRDLRGAQFGVTPRFVETCTATWLTSSMQGAMNA